MLTRRWSARTPGTGRLIALLCVFGPLTLFLAWAACYDLDQSDDEPHPVVMEFRMVSIRGKPLSPIACRSNLPGGRMVLSTYGRWWQRELDCGTMRYPEVRTGTYRWSGDTLFVHHHGAHPDEPPMHTLVLRGDTIDAPRGFRHKTYFVRYVRVRTPSSAAPP